MILKQQRFLIVNSWDHLVGTKAEFTLEQRILNTAGVLALLALLIFTFYDLAVVKIPVLAVATSITFLVQLSFYYLSRFKRRTTLPRLGFIIGSYIFLVLNYYYGSGINGATMFGFFLSFIVIIVVCNKKQHLLWIIIHCLVGLSLLYYEYTFSIENVYKNTSERFFDIGCTYVIILGLVFVIVRSVVGHYNRERNLATERAKELAIMHNENKRLFSIISHDLRSPLNSIQGYLELLTEHSLELTERLPIEKQLLDLTKGTSDLLYNLLAWSKTQLEGTKVSLQNIHLKNTLQPLLETLRHIAIKKNILLTTHIPAELNIFADSEMLQLVVRNLVYNAIKFTPEGGKITISGEKIDNQCTIQIQDTGIGIPSEKQHNVFSSQIKSSLGTNSEKGVGLGLLLCSDFITLQNGRIWFISKEGSGSTFYVSLPLGKHID